MKTPSLYLWNTNMATWCHDGNKSLQDSLHLIILGKEISYFGNKLEQPECLHSEDTPHCLMITHTIESYWFTSQATSLLSHIGSQIKRRQSQSYKFQEFANFSNYWILHCARHTFWSCLIRCANMKWIRWVLLKMQSGHDSIHRRTDRQGETSVPPFNFAEAGL